MSWNCDYCGKFNYTDINKAIFGCWCCGTISDPTKIKDGDVWWCEIDFSMTNCDELGEENQWPLVYCSKKNPEWPWKDNNGEYKECHVNPLWKMERTK